MLKIIFIEKEIYLSYGTHLQASNHQLKILKNYEIFREFIVKLIEKSEYETIEVHLVVNLTEFSNHNY